MKKLAVVVSASLVMAANAAVAAPYVGVKAGYSWLNDECTATSLCGDDDSASAGIFGGYEFNDFLALEAGWDYLGKFTGAGLPDDSVDAFTLAPKLSFGVTDAIDVYGKFGGAYVNYGDKSDESFLGALGLEFDVMENGSVRVEYQALTDINNDVVRAFANTASIGFAYSFGGSEAQPEPVVAEEVMVEEVVEVVVMTKTFEATLLDTETFALNSSELKPESTSKLDELVEMLNEYPQAQVNIVGYTDSSGAAEYNQKLSEKRAHAVANVLAERGVEPSRISVSGEGENNPIASNETKEGRAQNRRVEVTVPEFEYQVQQ
ncbi:outer membrane protein OmpA [Vibrio ichthyoenteri ATCC 700023]|uniref:Outer membrane protein OmpA n=1 Tax=Vibrio ichthyoenteri ATCC 700023 TaxID=870968 RepID=F9S2N6_9VIBR|nr:OmpA family protein [Vibrio ichthyoenteri]EGU39262.1 outer membrane protein OmpA [Vibrio ichthyoenteri ATCC 700023]